MDGSQTTAQPTLLKRLSQATIGCLASIEVIRKAVEFEHTRCTKDLTLLYQKSEAGLGLTMVFNALKKYVRYYKINWNQLKERLGKSIAVPRSNLNYVPSTSEKLCRRVIPF